MTAEARYDKDPDVLDFVASAALSAGEVIQLPDGRAGVVAGAKGFSSGETAAAHVRGFFNVAAATGVTFADGEPVYWDASADTAIAAGSAADGDFYIGNAAGAKTSGPLFVRVDLNGAGGAIGSLKPVFTSRVKLIDHADATEHILIDAGDNPNGLALVALLGEVSEQPAGSSEDQLVITLFDSDDNAIDTLTTTNTSPDAAGDVIVGATSMFSTATGGVFKKIPAGKGAYAKVTQATAGSPAGALLVRAVVMPLV